MDGHLGYDKNSVLGNNSDNSRNGYNHKTIISDYGESEIAVPRDRNGEFESKALKKRQVRTDGIERKFLAMHFKGMSQRDIEDSLREISECVKLRTKTNIIPKQFLMLLNSSPLY